MSAEPARPFLAPPQTSPTERQEQVLDRLLEWIRAVDAKTPIVMAIATGMLGVLAAVSPLPRALTLASVLWIALGTAPLIASLILCAMATFPQTSGPKGSLIYFGGITEHSFAEYSRRAQARTDIDYLDDLLVQSYRNAEIATAKFKHLRRALLWLLVGIPTWLAALYALLGIK